VSERDRQDLAQFLTDQAGRPPADQAVANNSAIETEIHTLRPLIEMLDRVGARMGRDLTRLDGPFAESDLKSLLGDFLIVRVIGRGGMGVVYEALQQSLGRRVALKILPSTCAGDPRKVQRFVVEAQAAAALQHPHIVPVYMVGSDGGTRYYAMQLIEGRTVADLIAEFRHHRGATSPSSGPTRLSRHLYRSCAELAQQAAGALHYAHEQGIIHRDVKPSNLLIDGSGWLWVSDFGLARIAGQAELTLSGAVLGTLRYMSPEQALAARVVVDHRSDVYSLGATLYELVTLHPIFEGDDRLELLRKISEEEPLAPRRIDPNIPRELETIVLKSIAKDPGERYATALELANDLDRFLKNRPILARPPRAIDHAARWVRRHKQAAAAGALSLVLMVIALGGAGLWRDGMLRRHNSELRSALRLAETNELTARRLWYDSQMMLAQQAWASGRVEFAQEISEGLRPEPGGHDLRGFEWNYLRRLCQSDFSMLSRKESQTTATAVSPDGRMLVTGHSTGEMVFWNLAANRELRRLRAYDGPVGHLSFSPDGRFLASASIILGAPNRVTLWNPGTGLRLASLPRVAGYINYLTFASGGNVLLLVVHDLNHDLSKNKLVFWDLAHGRERPRPGAASIACSRMTCSPKGGWLATSATSGNVTLRDASTGAARKALSRSFPWIGELAACPDGRTLAVAELTAVTLWDIETDRELGSVAVTSPGPLTFSPDGNHLAVLAESFKTIVLIKSVRTDPQQVALKGASGKLLHVAFSPDGRKLAGGGIGRMATVWDAITGQTLAEFPREKRDVGCLIFAPGGESLIVPSELGPIRAWQCRKRCEPVEQLRGHNAEVWGLAYAPDGSTLISSGDDHSIKLWGARDGRLRATLKGHTALVASLAIRADGKLLASAGFEGAVRTWDLPSGTPRAVLLGHTDSVRAVAFSSDRRLVASAGSDKSIRVWDVNHREPILVLEGHTDNVRSLAFDPTGALLVSASNDGTIRGIKVREGGKSFLLPCREHNSAVVFSPDGSLLASGDDEGKLTLWDVATWSKRRSVKVSDSGILCLAFSPNGGTIAAGCGDAKILLCDPLTGQSMLVLEGHTRRVNAVAFSPDGTTLASASHDQTVRLWHANDPLTATALP
jgi:WD40 repeat protein